MKKKSIFFKIQINFLNKPPFLRSANRLLGIPHNCVTPNK